MENVKISVYCLAYNCVNFIEEAINGMLNQKINVNYKIIIHDDASTDGTADIIRKYAESNSDKICAILQSENQYSKGIAIYKQYIEPNIEGEYIAICEGDDHWIDPNKLQLQYDYMEAHQECSLCAHNTERYDLETGKKSTFNDWKSVHILTADEIFLKYYIHTSSYFLRRKWRDWPGKRWWFGDYVTRTWAFYRGQVVSLPQIMSVYNSNNPNGVTRSIYCANIDRRISTKKEQSIYLNSYNILTQYKYDQCIRQTIKIFDFQCLYLKFTDRILRSFSRKEIIQAVKEVISHEYYKEYISSKKGIIKWLTRCKYEGYVLYPLWLIAVKYYLSRKELK